MEFFHLFFPPGGAVSVAVQRRLQLLVPDLLPDKISIKSVIQEGGNVGLPSFMRGSPLDSQGVAQPVHLKLDA